MVARSGDGTAIFHLGASCHGVGGRSLSDTLQFTKEVTLVRRLVVSDRLCHHGIAVLVVRPEGRDAVSGGMGCGEDADVLVVRCTHHHFFTPVSKDVGNGTCIVFRAVDGQAVVGVKKTP